MSVGYIEANHQDLIALRTEQGMHTEVPDLTGWAQVNGRNELPIPRGGQAGCGLPTARVFVV